MTNSTFVNHLATSLGISKRAAKNMCDAFEGALKGYISNMSEGDSVKVADVNYKMVRVPEKSGVDYLHGGSTWVKPEHNVLKVSVAKTLKAEVESA